MINLQRLFLSRFKNQSVMQSSRIYFQRIFTALNFQAQLLISCTVINFALQWPLITFLRSLCIDWWWLNLSSNVLRIRTSKKWAKRLYISGLSDVIVCWEYNVHLSVFYNYFYLMINRIWDTFYCSVQVKKKCFSNDYFPKKGYF